jgi:heterodisulfide reductase subunit B
MASTSLEQEAIVVPVNVDVRNSENIVDFLINKCRFCKLSYEDLCTLNS